MLHLFLLLFSLFWGHGMAGPTQDPGAMIPVTIRVATKGRPIFTPPAFEPRPNITFCQIYYNKEPDILDCLTIDHADYQFVDLEQIEPLLEDQRVLCDERAVGQQDTSEVLPFISRDALAFARSAWGSGKDLIFMAEDPHCFQGEGDRSFYLSDHIDWDDEDMTAIIRAKPLFADLYVKSGWAHNITRHLPAVPEGYFPHPRPSANRSVFINTELLKRGHPAKALIITKCVLGSIIPPLGGGLPACVLGVPYYAVVGAILDADKVSLHLKIGAILANFNPILGGVVGGIGALLLPNKIFWKVIWHHIWKGPVLIPWGREKPDSVKNHLPHITFDCPNCHVLGNFSVGLTVKFDITGRGHKGPVECVNSEKERFGTRSVPAPGRINHETFLELDRRAKHIRRALSEHPGKPQVMARTARHDRHFKRGNCDVSDETYPMCNKQEVDDYHKKCDAYLDNLLLHPTDIVKETLKCLAKSIVGKAECWEQFSEAAEYFDSPEDFMLKFIQRHLQEATFEMDVREKIDVQVQGVVEFDITFGTWFDIDLGLGAIPKDGEPVAIGWGFLLTAGDSSSMLMKGGAVPKSPEPIGGQIDGTDDERPKGHKNNGAGKMTWGLPVLRFEMISAYHLSANFTLPGFKAEIGPGAFKVDLLKPKDEMVESTLPINLEYLPANISLGRDPSYSVSWSVGPAFDVNFGDGMYGEGVVGDHIMAHFCFGGAIEFIKFELKIGLAGVDNPECKWRYGDEWVREGYIVGFYLRSGCRFYTSFGGLRVDTSWIGPLQKTPYAVRGLYYSWVLALRCWMVDEGKKNPIGEIEDIINKVLHDIQEPIKEEVAKISGKLDALGKHRNISEDPKLAWFGEHAYCSYHGICPPLPDKFPDPFPETKEECEASNSPFGKVIPDGEHSNCSNINQNTHLNYTSMVDERNSQFSRADNMALTKMIPGAASDSSVMAQTTPSQGVPTSGATAGKENGAIGEEGDRLFRCKMHGNCKP